ncbi:MAG: hypothetical protein AAFY31_01475 [Pseudomonadota bacterium]
MARMKRISKLWIVLGMVYAAFIAWHEPLRTPLSEDEVRAAFGGQYAQIRQSQDEQALAFLDFFLTDDGRPFFMVNLNALPKQTPDVEEAARQYGTFMMTQLLPRASYPVMSTDVITGLTNSLGADLTPFERLVVVRYRSRRDFLEIVASSEFRQEVRKKGASLDGWYSAPSTIGPTLSPPVLALCFLLFVGVIGTLRARPRSHANGQRNDPDASRRL